jgi:hypothetical protein
MQEMASVLVAESRALHELVYRLEALHYFVSVDEPSFLERAAGETAMAVESLRVVERARNTALQALATERRMSVSELTMRRLIDEADPAIGGLLGDLHGRFIELTGHVERLRRAITDSVGPRRQHIAQVLEAFSGAVPQNSTGTVYGAVGDLAMAGPATASRDLGRL